MITAVYVLVMVEAEVICRRDMVFPGQVTGKPRGIFRRGLAAGKQRVERRAEAPPRLGSDKTHDSLHFLRGSSCRYTP